MNIQIPWKIRFKGGSRRVERWWSGRKRRAAEHPVAPREEDLDHLGALHKVGR